MRYAQKQTVGIVLPDYEMPFCADGTPIDIIVNPHALPSRMTIGMLFEILSTKVGLHTCEKIDGSAFQGFSINPYQDTLFSIGYPRSGKEPLFNGKTGTMIECPVFVGFAYYMALRHHVQDKIQSRSRGHVKLLTHQPIGGRVNVGGIRVGEMEKDAFVSHGAGALVQERLCKVSDAFTTLFCKKCGQIATTGSSKPYCRFDKTSNPEDFVRITIPYASKVLFQELAGANIMVALKFASE